jgi:hypothetical protein
MTAAPHTERDGERVGPIATDRVLPLLDRRVAGQAGDVPEYPLFGVVGGDELQDGSTEKVAQRNAK